MNLLRKPLAGLALLLAGVLTFGLSLTASASASSTASTSAPKPTVVFVHGAFADAAGFSGSIESLSKRGYPVRAFANPLRGIEHDAGYLKLFLAQIQGPIVLVGHSYGGAVITNAATGNANVKALVYAAAYALDEGESVDAANHLGGGSSSVIEHVEVFPYPGAPQGPDGTPLDGDGYLKQSSFRSVFAADVPAAEAAVMAATQRPAALSSLLAKSGKPAWKSIPSWYLVAKQDKVIPPAAQRVMAKRARSRTVEITSSHSVMVSHDDAVTSLVLKAATAR